MNQNGQNSKQKQENCKGNIEKKKKNIKKIPKLVIPESKNVSCEGKIQRINTMLSSSDSEFSDEEMEETSLKDVDKNSTCK